MLPCLLELRLSGGSGLTRLLRVRCTLLRLLRELLLGRLRLLLRLLEFLLRLLRLLLRLLQLLLCGLDLLLGRFDLRPHRLRFYRLTLPLRVRDGCLVAALNLGTTVGVLLEF